MHAGGRPTTIDVEELKKKAIAYLADEPYPTIVNFCVRNDISKSRFYDLVEADKELSDIAKKIVTAREDVLERKGLSGDFNASMAKFALAQLGWSEKQEVDHTTKGKEIGIPVHQFVKSDG